MWYLDFYTIRKIPYKLHASLFVHDILAYIIPRQGCKISRTFRFTRSRCLFVETWEDPKPQHKMWLSHALFHPLVLFFIVLALPFIIKSSPQSLPPLPFFSSTHANTRVFLFILPFLLPLLNRLSTIQFRSGENRIFEIVNLIPTSVVGIETPSLQNSPRIRIVISKGHTMGWKLAHPKNGDRQPVFNFSNRFHRRYISIKGCRADRNRCTTRAKWPYRFCFLLQFIVTRPLLAETNDFHRLMNRSR